MMTKAFVSFTQLRLFPADDERILLFFVASWRCCAATKHALQGFFKTLATEVCDRGVNVSLVCPGPIMSDPKAPARKVYGSTGLVDGTDSGKRKDLWFLRPYDLH